MCQRILDFCNSSTRPLLVVGGTMSLLLALAIGYSTCSAQSLYLQIDPELAQLRSMNYHLQLGAALYLAVVAALSCQAAYYEQKNAIRALAIISSVNFVLAIAALAMTPSAAQTGSLFEPVLIQAKDDYDFREAFPALNSTNSPPEAADQRESEGSNPVVRVANSSSPDARPRRWMMGDDLQDSASSGRIISAPKKFNPHQATVLWDAVQARGCCGLVNATSTWSADKLPKSCCAPSSVKKEAGEYRCQKPDEQHEQGCLQLIGSTSLILFIVIALIAFNNLYLTVITGVSTYKTLQYSEASQSAYT